MKETCISVKNLYEKFGGRLSFATIEKSKDGDNEWFDLINDNGVIACMDGETARVIKNINNVVTFLNVEGEQNVKFQLTRQECEYAF